MHIKFVSSSSGSHGGGELFLYYLGQSLVAKGVEVSFWLSSGRQMDALEPMLKELGPVCRAPYVNTFKRKTRSFSHLYSRQGKLKRIAQQWGKDDPDIIHINKQCLEDGLDLLEAARLINVPHCCTIHITQTAVHLKAAMGVARDWVATRALKRYDGSLWAISKQRAEELGTFLGFSRAVPYVPNGALIPSRDTIEKEAKAARDQLLPAGEKGAFVITGVGRLMPQKDPMRFLEIVSILKKVRPDLHAFWVGDGAMREDFESKIQEMNAGSWIKCLGWQGDVSPYLSMADLYVHPAQFEGLPFSLLEAMARGKPCVLSPSLANELAEIPKDTWIIADETSNWVDMILDDMQRSSFAEKALFQSKEKFSTEAMADAYLELYEKLLSCKDRK